MRGIFQTTGVLPEFDDLWVDPNNTTDINVNCGLKSSGRSQVRYHDIFQPCYWRKFSRLNIQVDENVQRDI